jgi:RNA polymerase sigma factor (sigma-70 family)
VRKMHRLIPSTTIEIIEDFPSDDIENKDLVETYLSNCSSRHRDVLHLHYIKQLDISTVANRLNISPSTVSRVLRYEKDFARDHESVYFGMCS